MKTLAIIPARYQSSRFPGKPLADLCGKPMIWWVYNQVKKAKKVTNVIVATDDDRIFETCEKMSLNVIMTSDKHGSSTERLNEVAHKIDADLYLAINGDEPLIDPTIIDAIIPESRPNEAFYVSNLMTEIKDPVEALDFTNIKVVTDIDGNALFFSRNMIPYPKASLNYKFYKHVGVLIYSRFALEFFAETSKGPYEKVEDVNELRFVEHGKKLKMIKVEAHSLSVDTPKDLDRVRQIMAEDVSHEA